VKKGVVCTVLLLCGIAVSAVANVNSILQSLGSSDFQVLDKNAFQPFETATFQPFGTSTAKAVDMGLDIYHESRFYAPTSYNSYLDVLKPLPSVLGQAGYILARTIQNSQMTPVDPNGLAFKFSGDIQAPDTINPLMADTLWGYTASQITGAKATLGYTFK